MGARSARYAVDALLDATDASVLEWSYLTADEPFHRTLNEALAARGRRPLVGRSYERPLLRKGAATVSGQLRRQIAKSERTLRKQGALAYVELAPQDDIGRWIHDFLRLEARGWKGRQGSAMACAEANRTYFTRTVTAAFRRGRLAACGMDLDGQPLAAPDQRDAQVLPGAEGLERRQQHPGLVERVGLEGLARQLLPRRNEAFQLDGAARESNHGEAA